MKRRWPSRATLAALALFVCVLIVGVGVAHARPGGGQSFSGGGGHSSGGGGFSGGGSSHGGGGNAGDLIALVYYLILTLIQYPWIAIPILGGLVVYVGYSIIQHRHNVSDIAWDSGPAAELHHNTVTDNLRALDPDFSQVLFEDFAFRLFSTAHRARTTPAGLASIAPYVSPAAQSALSSREPDDGSPVEAVIVGAQRVINVDVPDTAVDDAGKPNYVRIAVEYEANVMVGEHTYYSVETWSFARQADRKSKPPGASKDFPCPNCGAPWQAKDTGTQVCSSCNQAVDNGRFDWVVERIVLDSMDKRPPSLTEEVPERGNDLPTKFEPTVTAAWSELVAADPAVTKAALQARVQLIYDKLNAAWSNNELEPARGLVSDGLFDYLEYWVKAYVSQHLRNQLTGMRITQPMAIAKVVRDKYYDAVTVRIWATGNDIVVDANTGKVVRGNTHKERAYSEYWTVIRAAGRTGAPKTEPVCGNCGAPLAITMAGNCEHCGAHITAGEFDWVLSKIEQDDSYRI